jgi:hypothetical protein
MNVSTIYVLPDELVRIKNEEYIQHAVSYGRDPEGLNFTRVISWMHIGPLRKTVDKLGRPYVLQWPPTITPDGKVEYVFVVDTDDDAEAFQDTLKREHG